MYDIGLFGAPFLHNVTLCSIVRNEEVNPAFGVEFFLDTIMPYVAAGIVVYSPSFDNTENIVKQATYRYPHMKAIKKNFDGYANLRNIGLRQVRTKYALVLDADEFLARSDLRMIEDILHQAPSDKKRPMGFNFRWKNVYPDNHCLITDCPNPRLFEVSNNIFMSTRYVGGLHEYLWLGDKPFHQCPEHTVQTRVLLKHFCPSQAALQEKFDRFYAPQDENRHLPDGWFGRHFVSIFGKKLQLPPEMYEVPSWKKPNPRRALYF